MTSTDNIDTETTQLDSLLSVLQSLGIDPSDGPNKSAVAKTKYLELLHYLQRVEGEVRRAYVQLDNHRHRHRHELGVHSSQYRDFSVLAMLSSRHHLDLWFSEEAQPMRDLRHMVKVLAGAIVSELNASRHCSWWDSTWKDLVSLFRSLEEAATYPSSAL